jgi:hypothetical protein
VAADWVTISSLATAGGTLVLAVATFGSVRSANRAARVAEESLLAGIRPLLMPSRPEDASQKVGFADGHWTMVAGSGGTVEIADDGAFLTMSLRNAGTGIAVLHGWRLDADPLGSSGERPSLDAFRRLSRDLYIAAGDIGFWQGAIRDPGDPDYALVKELAASGERIGIDVLYGDHQGGQRVISRFSLLKREDGRYLAIVGRHWNVDRPDPR